MAGQIAEPEEEKALLEILKKLCEKYKTGLAYAKWNGSHTGESIIQG
jgi:hypothetical protein